MRSPLPVASTSPTFILRLPSSFAAASALPDISAAVLYLSFVFSYSEETLPSASADADAFFSVVCSISPVLWVSVEPFSTDASALPDLSPEAFTPSSPAL